MVFKVAPSAPISRPKLEKIPVCKSGKCWVFLLPPPPVETAIQTLTNKPMQTIKILNPRTRQGFREDKTQWAGLLFNTCVGGADNMRASDADVPLGCANQ